jgi:hypothetical protein
MGRQSKEHPTRPSRSQVNAGACRRRSHRSSALAGRRCSSYGGCRVDVDAAAVVRDHHLAAVAVPDDLVSGSAFVLDRDVASVPPPCGLVGVVLDVPTLVTGDTSVIDQLDQATRTARLVKTRP